MPDNSRTKSIILAFSIVFIALSAALFLHALSVGDFAQPGQPFYQGRSNVRLVIAFGILCSVALVLLTIVFRSPGSLSRLSSSPAPRKKPLSTTVAAAHVPEQDTAVEQKPDANELLSETAEELRTSVDVIQEELEELIDDELPADKEHMQTLYEETDRIRKIIDGMEQLSRAQALARSPGKEAVIVEPLLNGLVDKARLSAQGKSVTFTMECESSLSMTANPDCLGQIMANLLDNAVKAVKEEGSVTVGAVRRGEEVVFTVKDTGTGIRRKHLGHIYERFFRGSGTGIGMGLAIVKELVDAGGGKIEVQTKPGEGTTFTVHLPAA